MRRFARRLAWGLAVVVAGFIVASLATLRRLDLSEAGFERLAGVLERTFAGGPDGAPADDLGPGIYGPSRFYRAVGAFNVVNVCNHWVSDLLDAAGVPTDPVLATLPQGLFLDLRWRPGIVPLARTGP